MAAAGVDVAGRVDKESLLEVLEVQDGLKTTYNLHYALTIAKN